MVNKVTEDSCVQREEGREGEREREGKRRAEIVQLVAQSVHSLFIQFLSV